MPRVIPTTQPAWMGVDFAIGHDRMVMSFTVPGPPRTKKTSQRIVQIKAKGGGRGFTKILPSEAFMEWFKRAMQYAPLIRAQLARAGVRLPITAFVQVRATFYRDRDSGDLLGYEQALADWLQAPKINERGKLIRQGAGVIADDVQIRSWDGSRLSKDAACPRIEVELSVIGERPASGDLFEEEGF
jgi:hypothetical protein